MLILTVEPSELLREGLHLAGFDDRRQQSVCRHGILFLIVGIIIVTLGIGKIQHGRGGVNPDATLDRFDGGLDDLR